MQRGHSIEFFPELIQEKRFSNLTKKLTMFVEKSNENGTYEGIYIKEKLCVFKNFKNIYLHPFVNDRSICMSINDLEKFLKRYDISINWENL